MPRRRDVDANGRRAARTRARRAAASASAREPTPRLLRCSTAGIAAGSVGRSARTHHPAGASRIIRSWRTASAVATWLASWSSRIALVERGSAQGLIIYPAKGQSQAKQDKDEAECQTWAKNNTGVDPLALAHAGEPAPAGCGSRAAGAGRR